MNLPGSPYFGFFWGKNLWEKKMEQWLTFLNKDEIEMKIFDVKKKKNSSAEFPQTEIISFKKHICIISLLIKFLV